MENITENMMLRLLDVHKFNSDKAYDHLVFAENTMTQMRPWELNNGREDFKHIVDMKFNCILGKDKKGHTVEYIDASAYYPALLNNDYTAI